MSGQSSDLEFDGHCVQSMEPDDLTAQKASWQMGPGVALPLALAARPGARRTRERRILAGDIADGRLTHTGPHRALTKYKACQ